MSRTFKFTFAIGFVTFLGAIAAGIYIPALPELEKIFHVHSFHIKSSITLYFIGTMVGASFIGPLSDRYGRQLMLIGSLLLFSSASLLCSQADSIITFLIGRFLEGLGIIGAPIIAFATTADHYKGFLYKHIVSFLMAILTLGTGISHVIGTLLFTLLGWRSIFYFLTLMGILAIRILSFTSVDSRMQHHTTDELATSSRIFIQHPFFKYYQIMIGALEGAFYTFIVLSPYIFRVHYGWGMVKFSLFGALLPVGTVIAAIVHNRLSSFVGNTTMLFIGMSMLVFVCLILFFTDTALSDIELGAVVICFVTGSDIMNHTLIPKALKAEPLFPGTSSSLMILSKSLASVLGLGVILLLPETIRTVSYIVFATLCVCSIGYLKVRKDLPREV